ncbi:MAG: Nif3-like dinuclear metal center hexameric protein [Cytophagales bacterium]|nr:Nif3-like dinuclear metal center hexameric protein [Cytophagales bacterium]
MQTTKIKDVIAYLESHAPRAYQESYDNSGLLTGDLEAPVTGTLLTIDCTEEVVEEAAVLGCNLIISHHPILFKGLKSLTGRTYVERTIMASVRKEIAIYAAHTNLDNVRHGVNKKIADQLGLVGTQILRPSRGSLSKLVTFVPPDSLDKVLEALHHAGAGSIGNYENCSFQVQGTGTFRPNQEASPVVGKAGNLEKAGETRVEVIFPTHVAESLLAALRGAHPYEEVAYYLSSLENENQDVGAGIIGELASPQDALHFLEHVKKVMQAPVIRHTALPGKPIHKVAVCGGAGSFLLPDAIRRGAQVYISADFKYHEFFDADGKILIADIGHYESEQYTKELFWEVLNQKFTTFAFHFSKTATNPIRYL